MPGTIGAREACRGPAASAELDAVQMDGRRDPEMVAAEQFDAAIQFVLRNIRKDVAHRRIVAAGVLFLAPAQGQPRQRLAAVASALASDQNR